MAGDEIVAEWLGNVYAATYNTSTSPLRFNATSKRFRTLKIFCNSSSYRVYIGKFYANSATFVSYAFSLGPYETIKFEYIDLYELGYKIQASPVSIKVLGINEY